MSNPVQVVLGLLLFLLPGYCLTKLLFPGRRALHAEYNMIYVIGLSMALSLAVAVLLAFIIGSLPPDPVTGMGYYQAPYIVAATLLTGGLLFTAAWRRGAFPWLGRLHPRLHRVAKSDIVPEPRMEELRAVREELFRKVERLRKALTRARRADAVHLRERLQAASSELAKVEDELKEAGDGSG